MNTDTDKSSFETFYKSIGKLYCPYFQEYVHFTDEGWKHIRFKNEQLIRPSKDIDNRIKSLPKANVFYYEFSAIIDERRIRVVIKQVENSEKVFLSVIPLFKQKMPLDESDIL